MLGRLDGIGKEPRFIDALGHRAAGDHRLEQGARPSRSPFAPYNRGGRVSAGRTDNAGRAPKSAAGSARPSVTLARRLVAPLNSPRHSPSSPLKRRISSPALASEHVDEIVRLWGLKLDRDAGAKSGLDEEPLRLGGHSAGNLIQFRAKGKQDRRHATSRCPRQSEQGSRRAGDESRRPLGAGGASPLSAARPRRPADRLLAACHPLLLVGGARLAQHRCRLPRRLAARAVRHRRRGDARRRLHL